MTLFIVYPCIHTIINHTENEDENEKYITQIEHDRPRSRHEHKYSKYKEVSRMMMLLVLNNT